MILGSIPQPERNLRTILESGDYAVHEALATIAYDARQGKTADCRGIRQLVEDDRLTLVELGVIVEACETGRHVQKSKLEINSGYEYYCMRLLALQVINERTKSNETTGLSAIQQADARFYFAKPEERRLLLNG